MNSTVFGRIGQDAELRQTNNGTDVANFSVALNVYSKSSEGRQTTWVKATVFGKQAESLAPYLTKGTAVALSGDLTIRKYETRDGSGVSLDMAVNSVALLGGGQKKDDAPARPQNRSVARPAPRKAEQQDEPDYQDNEVGF